MADTADLSINNNQAEHTEGLNGEDRFTPPNRCIEDISVTAVMKKKNKPSQKYDGSAPSGGIVLMAVPMVS